MKKKFVYDLPTRIFHWSFALLFILAFIFAKILGEKSPFFQYHMLIGMVMSLAVLGRIIWGLIGNTYARFLSFPLDSHELLTYFKDLFTKKTKLYLGHNPASSWAALIMMGATLGLALSGYMMVQGNEREVYKDIHEFFFVIFVSTVILHIFGIIIHTIFHKDLIMLSMITGKKKTESSDESVQEKSYRLVGVVFFFLLGLFAFYLYKNYNLSTHNLSLLGMNLDLSIVE